MTPRLEQLRRNLSLKFLRSEIRRVREKYLRKVRRIEDMVLTLEPEGEAKGDVLFAYIIDAFRLPPGSKVPHSHTHWWESLQIARTFLEMGYRVDVLSWKNGFFRPQKDYRAAVDVRLLLERWAPDLPADCVKILHAETSHHSFHNHAQTTRLRELEARRGFRIAPQKMMETNLAVETADVVTMMGNHQTASTYRFAEKRIFPIPISTPLTYPVLERDFASCRRNFLWFGSGGLVHKGLDRVLEAFAGAPELHLTVCGPIEREHDFERAYWRELYRTPNIRCHGWIDVAGQDFLELCRRTLAMVYPSCSEGQCGGVVNCMHAGLVPVISRESGVPIDPSYGHLLADCSVETIRETARELAARPPAELEAMSNAARAYVLEHNTRETFAPTYRRAIETILGETGPKP